MTKQLLAMIIGVLTFCLITEWLKENLCFIQEDGGCATSMEMTLRPSPHEVINDLKEAMRPQQQEDN